MNIFKRKSIDEVLDKAGKNSGLKKTLGIKELFLLGLGSIIGTGIFVTTGIAAVTLSGPAVILSYALAGITTIFIALAYTEVATMIPTSGGAYSYSYIAFGEIVAWIVSWMIILYLILASATVASGWSGYMLAMLESGGINLPEIITKIPSEGGFINLPGLLISLTVMGLLVKGTKESVAINSVLVVVKMLSIGLFIYVAAPHFDPIHWFAHNHPFQTDLALASPFMPFGVSGVITGATLVFFAYNGFDSLAAAAEECKNPKRDLTISILGSLFVCMILYMVVAGLLVGIIPFNLIDIKSSLPSALSYNKHFIVSSIISAGVVLGMVTVILVQLYAVSRVILVTARDGLLPPILAKIHPKFQTPYISTIFCGVIVALLAGFVPIDIICTMSSVGALFSFTMVSAAMLTLRFTHKDVKRTFKCPLPFLTGGIAILMSMLLLISAMQKVGIYIGFWIGAGILFYFVYYKMRVKE